MSDSSKRCIKKKKKTPSAFLNVVKNQTIKESQKCIEELNVEDLFGKPKDSVNERYLYKGGKSSKTRRSAHSAQDLHEENLDRAKEISDDKNKHSEFEKHLSKAPAFLLSPEDQTKWKRILNNQNKQNKRKTIVQDFKVDVDRDYMKRQSTVELNLIMNSADDHVGGFVKNIIPKEKIESTSEESVSDDNSSNELKSNQQELIDTEKDQRSSTFHKSKHKLRKQSSSRNFKAIKKINFQSSITSIIPENIYLKDVELIKTCRVPNTNSQIKYENKNKEIIFNEIDKIKHKQSEQKFTNYEKLWIDKDFDRSHNYHFEDEDVIIQNVQRNKSVQNKRNDKISHHKSIIYEHDRLAPK